MKSPKVGMHYKGGKFPFSGGDVHGFPFSTALEAILHPIGDLVDTDL